MSNDLKLVVNEELLSFTDAEQACRGKGGKLASVLSQDENNLVQELCQSTGQDEFLNNGCWLGLNNLDEDDTNCVGVVRISVDFWDDGDEIVFNNFHSGQPDGTCQNGESQHCTIMMIEPLDDQLVRAGFAPGEWDDARCSESRPSICKIPKLESDINDILIPVVSSVCAVLVICGAIFLWRRRKRKTSPISDDKRVVSEPNPYDRRSFRLAWLTANWRQSLRSTFSRNSHEKIVTATGEKVSI